MQTVVKLSAINLADRDKVGGKNASLGEMLQHLSGLGINVPDGFATTIDAYKQFISQHHLDQRITQLLAQMKMSDLRALNKASLQIRKWILATPFLKAFEKDITEAYQALGAPVVAVRSSAILEDMAAASFAGAQDTLLNIKGIKNVLLAIKHVFASVYTARAIAYRHDCGFDAASCAISVGIQPMVRSDKGVSGVMFSIDTESGFDKVILLTAIYGLGEAIVQGRVNPDEFMVYKEALQRNQFAILQRKLGEKALKTIYGKSKSLKTTIKNVRVPEKDRLQFCINDEEVQTLAQHALRIEEHYGKPMDIEWAKDGVTGKLYILQARPETVQSKQDHANMIERYTLDNLEKPAKVITKGQSIGQRIGDGKACVILDAKKMSALKSGDVLVTDMTDPDWEPAMRRASAIVTNRGGRTCHAAIIARELGIPAVVGCGDATKQIKHNKPITVSCAEGQVGYVYEGKLSYQRKHITIQDMPKLPVQFYLNLGNPEKAFSTQFLPNDGVGLARLEFIISNMIGVHPNAVLGFNKLPATLKQQISKKTLAYDSPVEFYIEKLREGISMIAAAFYPKDVIFRFSDFKSNEYANLLGGQLFEPHEENPMLGFRGAARYRDKHFMAAFELECKAFKRVREDMGLINAQLMVPFVRTVEELVQVVALIENNGLKRGTQGLKIYMMCEIPANVLLAKDFLEYVDGYSIGSNDLTQLTLGLDRDSNLVAHLFDERNEAVKLLLQQAIEACKQQNKYIGICGQAPSDYPELATWLMQQGIESISLNPDSIVDTWLLMAEQKEVINT